MAACSWFFDGYMPDGTGQLQDAIGLFQNKIRVSFDVRSVCHIKIPPKVMSVTFGGKNKFVRILLRNYNLVLYLSNPTSDSLFCNRLNFLLVRISI